MASAEPEATLDNLVLKKSNTSVVWKYFGFRTTDVQQKQVLCTTCVGKVATSRGNATNLYQHFKKHHRQLYDECTDEDTALTKEIKSLVLGYMENKYSDPATQELLDITSFVDPRFKTDYMSEKRAHASTTDAVLPSAGEAEPFTSKKAKRSLGSFFKSSAAVPPASTAVQLEGAIEAEVNTYLMTPTIDGEEDPLAWWK
ncbi:Zinc finger BED domain containing protein 1, partial [Dissostichus eleginoides]